MRAAFPFPEWFAPTIPILGLAIAGLIYWIGRMFFVSGKNEASGPVEPLAYRLDEPEPYIPIKSDLFLEGSPNERRTHFRRGGHSTDIAVSHTEHLSELLRGVIVDRSAGGVSLTLPAPLEVGAVVSIRPNPSSRLSTWVQAEVCYCRRRRNEWHIGLRFIQTPPLSVLWMFG
jgi:hypothetical protein